VTKGNATKSTGRIAWGRYLLLFFVAAWMFVLGVLVGRGTAPVHFDTQALQNELAALRDAMVKQERETVEKAIRGEDEKAPLEFYEKLKKDGPDDAIQLEASPTATEAAPEGKPEAEGRKPPHKSRAAIMAKKKVLPIKPATSTETPKRTQPAAPEGKLTIQVASLKDGAAAKRIVENLKSKGYPAYLSRTVIPEKGLWFRVRVGSYRDREQAAADMARLTRDRKKPILVTKVIKANTP
jgi:cell division septation protein DedD